MEVMNLGRTIAQQLQEDGAEETIRAIKRTVSNMPPWALTSIHWEYIEVLNKAIPLIEEGKIDELRQIDEELENLRIQDLFD